MKFAEYFLNQFIKLMRKSIFILLLSILFCDIIYAQSKNTIEPELQEVINRNDHELISVNIVFKSQISRDVLRNAAAQVKGRDVKREVVVNELKSFSKETQRDVLSILEAEQKNMTVTNIRCHWLSNVINCKVTPDVIYKLAHHQDIDVISYNEDQYLFWDEEMKAVEPARGVTQNITHVHADDVWDLGYTGKGVLVAVIDSGVNLDHIDLADNLWDGGEAYPNHGYNTYDDNNYDLEDGFGHGTHCAGIICGNGTSGTQTGLAPDATLMCIKVVNNGGSGSASSMCAGIEFAIDNGADVLNMSLGIPHASTQARLMLRTSCVNAMECGIVSTVAVGNEGQLQISFPVPNNVRVPGGCPPPWIHPDQEANSGGTSCVVAVGAVNFSNERAPFSSYGPFTWEDTSFGDYPYDPEMGLIRPDVCAPGVGIVSADPENANGHTTMDGTSQAAPCVAGVVCLLLDKNPDLTPEEISIALETTTLKLSENKDNYTGSGLVNALLAIESIGAGIVEDCDAPTNLEASTIDEYSIELEWEASATAVSYNIYRNNAFVGNSTTTTYTDDDLVPNTEYCYTVSSVCEEGESARTEEACAKTDEISLSCDAPTNLEATVEEDVTGFDYKFKVTLSWDEVDGAQSYLVYADGEMIEEVTTPSYIYGTDVEGTVTFTVATKCAISTSSLSEELIVEIKYQDISEYENRFEVYPNPVNDKLFINTNEVVTEVEIHNIIGLSVYCGNDSSKIIDMSNLNDGIYFVRIKTDKGEITKKVVKK